MENLDSKSYFTAINCTHNLPASGDARIWPSNHQCPYEILDAIRTWIVKIITEEQYDK